VIQVKGVVNSGEMHEEVERLAREEILDRKGQMVWRGYEFRKAFLDRAPPPSKAA